MNKWMIIGGFVLIALIVGGIEECNNHLDDKKRKEIQAYMDEGDYDKAEELMKESGVEMPLFYKARMEDLIAEGELRLAKNLATDHLDEGYYAEAILSHLYDLYELGGEEQVVTALSSFTYPVSGASSKWNGKMEYGWYSNDLNKLYSHHNAAIEQFLLRMQGANKQLSKNFKHLLDTQLQPLYEKTDNDYARTDFSEVKTIKRKFGL